MTTHKNILVVGDSLTEQGFENQWCAKLQHHYQRRADVVCRGFGGYNTRWVLETLESSGREHIIPPHVVDQTLFCVVFLGANDAVSAEYPQHVPLDEYEANLRKIATCLNDVVRPAHGVIILTPPPIDQVRYLEYVRRERVPGATSSSRTLENTRNYRNAALRVASGLAFATGVDLYTAFMGEAAEGSFEPNSSWSAPFVDGLHFNAYGGNIVFNALISSIAEGAHAEKNQMTLPHWSARCS